MPKPFRRAPFMENAPVFTVIVRHNHKKRGKRDTTETIALFVRDDQGRWMPTPWNGKRGAATNHQAMRVVDGSGRPIRTETSDGDRLSEADSAWMMAKLVDFAQRYPDDPAYDSIRAMDPRTGYTFKCAACGMERFVQHADLAPILDEAESKARSKGKNRAYVDLTAL